MSIFEYDEEKELALFRAAEREEGLEQGLILGREQGFQQGYTQGLRALISTLKKFCADPDEIYIQVTQNPIYADLTREDFESYL